MGDFKENLALVFYVGTHRLAGFVAEVLPDRNRILRFSEIQNAEGFQKGGVAQVEKALASLSEVAKRLELGEEAVEIPAYVLLSNSQLKMTRYSSSVYYSGYPRVITAREIRQVIEQTRSVAPLPLEDWILQVVPESFWVNDLTGVQDPTGLEAQRLAVTLQIFSTNYTLFRNVSRAFEALEFNVKAYFPKTSFLPEGVLNASERESEALVIDLNDETTHLLSTREGRILRAKSLDLGDRLLTNRIAESWQIGERDAERLKERFGSLEDLQHGEELIPLTERKGGEKSHPPQIKRAEFHRRFLNFGEELFSRIGSEVKQFLSEDKTNPELVVLTGRGAKLEGVLEFLNRRFSFPIRLGTPRGTDAPAEILMDPAWVAPVGFVKWLASRAKDEATVKENLVGRVLIQAKEFLAAYF